MTRLIAIFSLSLLLFLSSSHGLQMSSTASPSQYNALDQFSARVIAGFIEGTIGGLLQEQKGNYSLLELELAFNCSSEARQSSFIPLLSFPSAFSYLPIT
jgi:hypothetical protein